MNNNSFSWGQEVDGGEISTSNNEELKEMVVVFA